MYKLDEIIETNVHKISDATYKVVLQVDIPRDRTEIKDQ